MLGIDVVAIAEKRHCTLASTLLACRSSNSSDQMLIKYFRQHILCLYPRVFAFRRKSMVSKKCYRYSSTIDTGRDELKPKSTTLKEK